MQRSTSRRIKKALILLLAFFLIGTISLLLSFSFYNKLKDWHQVRRRTFNLAAKLSGPPTLPLIGNALIFACKQDEILNRIVDVVNCYKTPGRFWLGSKLLILLSEPKDYEVILSCQNASHKAQVYQFLEPFVGQGLVTGSGPIHRAHRKAIMPMLNNKALLKYLERFDFHSRICSELLEEKVGAGVFDLHSYMTRCTFDMIFDTILGVPGTAQKNGLNDLVYWTETMYQLVHERVCKVWLHSDWIFSMTNLGKRHKKGQRFIHSFIENAVSFKKKEQHSSDPSATAPDSPRLVLLEQLIDHIAKTNLMNDVELRDQTYTIFTAAQDTTAVIACFALLNLAINQEIQSKLREEIKNVVGNGSVKVEHLPELKYGDMVIKETVRLYPIAPFMVRQATGDIKLETCTLPQGCSIVMLPFLTQRSREYWTDPEKFIPERFLPENTDGRHPYAYIPFSGGLRGCIGQKFAVMCLKTILVHIIRKFRLTSPQNLETLQLKTDISIRSRDGYMVSLERI